MKNVTARREGEEALRDLAAQLEMNNISRRALHGIYLRTRRSPNVSFFPFPMLTLLLFWTHRHRVHATFLSLDTRDAE
jgi:hypothetical protein